ncbi:MAG: NAD(+) diphosphatase [Erysipelotrichaceae bacterium]|nr:NAD(+) diphosphatase [Erysipelotrichaceae bacterium]
MIQEINPYHFDNSYRNEKATCNDKALSFKDGKICVSYDEENRQLIYPNCEEGKEYIYAFSIDEEKYFLHFMEEETDETLFSMRDLMGLDLKENKEVFAAYSAYHLYEWYRTSRYCGACGEKLIYGDEERVMICPKCGNHIYPRINPAVIIGIKNGDKLLLTKYRTGFSQNALVAGFTEFGETLEETVKREVKEETGLNVKNIRYYKSQPWGIASDILAGYYCEVDGDDHIRMDQHELRYAEWVKREDIILQNKRYSLTNEMMERFKLGIEK